MLPTFTYSDPDLSPSSSLLLYTASNMPAHVQKIHECSLRLGLTNSFATNRPPHNTTREISWLFRTVAQIANAYRLADEDLIRPETVAIGRMSDLILDIIGAEIWGDGNAERVGLFGASELRASAMYPRDLYWGIEEDRTL